MVDGWTKGSQHKIIQRVWDRVGKGLQVSWNPKMCLAYHAWCCTWWIPMAAYWQWLGNCGTCNGLVLAAEFAPLRAGTKTEAGGKTVAHWKPWAILNGFPQQVCKHLLQSPLAKSQITGTSLRHHIAMETRTAGNTIHYFLILPFQEWNTRKYC